MMWTMSLSDLRNFVSQFVTLEWQDLSFPRFTSTMGSRVDVFYNQILKIARQCEFPDMDNRIIDTIIFVTNCY